MEIKPLSGTSPDELFGAFEQAFVDYEVQLNKAELMTMLKRRGFDPRASFGAFDGNKLVSFTCNGIGCFCGIPTAYDTGTGTLKEYQGRGLAAQVFEHSIPHLKELGIEAYLLEVLQHNTPAISVYRKLGFAPTREFYYFKARNGEVAATAKPLDFPYTLQSIGIDEVEQSSKFLDFHPSWQNSIEAIGRVPEDFSRLGIFTEGKLIGYGVFEPLSGDVTQIAVDKQYRRRGVGSLLFANMLQTNRHDYIKIINSDIDCTPITAFLQSKGLKAAGKQFEMIKKL